MVLCYCQFRFWLSLSYNNKYWVLRNSRNKTSAYARDGSANEQKISGRECVSTSGNVRVWISYKSLVMEYVDNLHLILTVVNRINFFHKTYKVFRYLKSNIILFKNRSQGQIIHQISIICKCLNLGNPEIISTPIESYNIVLQKSSIESIEKIALNRKALLNFCKNTLS
jgi:hypothetical protein